MEIFATILAIISLLIFGVVWWHMRQVMINTRACMDQIRKLILANNIDRAIKLCNAAPDAPLPKAIKLMLTRANRVHELELAYEEARMQIASDKKNLTGSGGLNLTSMTQLTLYLLMILLVLVASEMSNWMVGAVIVMVVADLGRKAVERSIRVHLIRAEESLLSLRSWLYGRAKYVPLHLRPRSEEDLSPDKIVQWREYMDEFNRDLSRQRQRGEEERPAEEVYEAAVAEKPELLPKI